MCHWTTTAATPSKRCGCGGRSPTTARARFAADGAHRKTFTETFKRFSRDKTGARCTTTPTTGRLGRLLQDGRRKHHRFLPASDSSLSELLDEGRDVSLVIRTFGSDGPTVALALRAWIAGRHPTVAARKMRRIGSARPRLRGQIRRGGPLHADAAAERRWQRRCLQAEAAGGDVDGGAAERHGHPGRLRLVGQARRGAGGRQTLLDHARQRLPPRQRRPRARNSDWKSIVAARCRSSPGEAFQPLDGPATRALHGAYLVRVPTIPPVRDQGGSSTGSRRASSAVGHFLSSRG